MYFRGTLDSTFQENVPKERILLAYEPAGKGHQKSYKI